MTMTMRTFVSRALLVAHVAAMPAVSSLRVERDATTANPGCHTEPPRHEGRALQGPFTRTDDMTPDACRTFCADYRYAGVEFGRECFCGNEIAPNAQPAEGECTMPCSGDGSLTCGAGDRVDIYLNDAYVEPTIKTVAGFASKGCRAEPYEARAMPDKRYEQDDMTPETCTALCSADGFLYAGLQWGRECWCANTIKGGHWVPASECDTVCAGDRGSFCGAHKRNTVYGPESVAPALVGGRPSIGCVTDGASTRSLDGAQTVSDDMTGALCADFCHHYTMFGLENGNECYCGNVLRGSFVDESLCASPCYGDGLATCGGPGHITAYTNGEPPNLRMHVGGFTHLHCGADSVADRVLQGGYTHGDDMTVEKCAADCADFAYFGVEYGRECFCGNEYGGVEVPDAGCFMRCSGDNLQRCGGADRLEVYKKDEVEDCE